MFGDQRVRKSARSNEQMLLDQGADLQYATTDLKNQLANEGRG